VFLTLYRKAHYKGSRAAFCPSLRYMFRLNMKPSSGYSENTQRECYTISHFHTKSELHVAILTVSHIYTTADAVTVCELQF